MGRTTADTLATIWWYLVANIRSKTVTCQSIEGHGIIFDNWEFHPSGSQYQVVPAVTWHRVLTGHYMHKDNNCLTLTCPNICINTQHCSYASSLLSGSLGNWKSNPIKCVTLHWWCNVIVTCSPRGRDCCWWVHGNMDPVVVCWSGGFRDGALLPQWIQWILIFGCVILAKVIKWLPVRVWWVVVGAPSARVN